MLSFALQSVIVNFKQSRYFCYSFTKLSGSNTICFWYYLCAMCHRVHAAQNHEGKLGVRMKKKGKEEKKMFAIFWHLTSPQNSLQAWARSGLDNGVSQYLLSLID